MAQKPFPETIKFLRNRTVLTGRELICSYILMQNKENQRKLKKIVISRKIGYTDVLDKSVFSMKLESCVIRFVPVQGYVRDSDVQ